MTRKHAAGFTLIEALVVISLIAILVAIAAPSFRDFVARRSIAAHVSELAGTIRLARTEAIKRGMPVTICHSAAPQEAAPVCAIGTAGQGWATGWVLFVDRGARGLFEPGDVVIRVQPPLEGSGGIVTSDGSDYSLTFLPTGLGVGIQGSLIFRPNVPETDPSYISMQKTMCVAASGRTRLVSGSETC